MNGISWTRKMPTLRLVNSKNKIILGNSFDTSQAQCDQLDSSSKRPAADKNKMIYQSVAGSSTESSSPDVSLL